MTGEELKAAVREALREELPRLLAEMQAAAGAERLLDVDEAAQRLGLSPSTVYKKAQVCELSSVKAGARVLFLPADLDAYAEARRRSPERVQVLAKKRDGA